MTKRQKIVVLSGAGISKESGIETYRSDTGQWSSHNIIDVCHPLGWQNNPELVLEFYNSRRKEVQHAQPNMAHLAIAKLEASYDVVVVTQNIDDLHERAGSTNVIHLHGEITKVRSDTTGDAYLYDVGYQPTKLGDLCQGGHQLRPHIVWFEEHPFFFNEAATHFKEADKVLIIGTSLLVYPAASLPDYARKASDKVCIDPSEIPPEGFKHLCGLATEQTPTLVKEWLS